MGEDVSERRILGMDPEPVEIGPILLAVPPSYEQSVATAVGWRADYVVSPLEMAALFDWDDEEYE